jgi:hypothetical protein
VKYKPKCVLFWLPPPWDLCKFANGIAKEPKFWPPNSKLAITDFERQAKSSGELTAYLTKKAKSKPNFLAISSQIKT